MVFGLLGQAFFMGGFQQVLSVLIGSVLLVSVILPSVFTSFKLRPFQNFSFRLKAGFQELFRRKGVSVLFLTGLMNGLLPCGLVYVALAAATSTGSFVQGAWFMLVFGMGTFPVMLALPLFGQVIKVKYRNQMRKIVPVVISLMAVLLILRGLNLGIPYVSPRIDRTNEAGALNCHEKTSDSGLSSDIPCGPHSKTQVLSKEENNNTSE